MGWWKLKTLTCLVAAWTRKNGWNSTSVVLFGIAGKGPLSVVLVHVRPFDSAAFVDYMSSWESHKEWNKQHDKISNKISFYINMAKKGIKTSVTKVSKNPKKSEKLNKPHKHHDLGAIKNNKWICKSYMYIYYDYPSRKQLKPTELGGFDRWRSKKNWWKHQSRMEYRPLCTVKTTSDRYTRVYDMPYMAGLNKNGET